MTDTYEAVRDDVLSECELTLARVDAGQVDRMVEEILTAEQVFLIGVGRVMLALQCFAKRLSHLGIKAYCVGAINETAMTKNDLLIVGSGSGETVYPAAIATKAKALGAKIVHIGSVPASGIAREADVFVRVPAQSKKLLDDEVRSCQPMTTLFEQSLFLLGDIACLKIIRKQHVDMDSLWRYHANLE